MDPWIFATNASAAFAVVRTPAVKGFREGAKKG